MHGAVVNYVLRSPLRMTWLRKTLTVSSATPTRYAGTVSEAVALTSEVSRSTSHPEQTILLNNG